MPNILVRLEAPIHHLSRLISAFRVQLQLSLLLNRYSPSLTYHNAPDSIFVTSEVLRSEGLCRESAAPFWHSIQLTASEGNAGQESCIYQYISTKVSVMCMRALMPESC